MCADTTMSNLLDVKTGDIVGYKRNKHDRYPPAFFIGYHDGQAVLASHPKDPCHESNDCYFSVYDHNIEPYYESQFLEVKYSDLYEILDDGLSGDLQSRKREVLIIMKELGFDVPEIGDNNNEINKEG